MTSIWLISAVIFCTNSPVTTPCCQSGHCQRSTGNRVCGPASVYLVCGIATHPVRCSCPDSADPPPCGGLTLFLGPGRGGSTPRHGSDVASGFPLQMKLTHRRTRAFDPHARKRPHPGQHRLPPRSSGHDPRSRRGKHADYRRGLEGGDEIFQRKL
jgi:hypothetical protein